MGTSTTLTIRLSSETRDKLDRIASDTRRSKSFLAAEALAAYADRELEILGGLSRGLADAAAGRVVSHEQVKAEAEQIVRDAKRAASARK